MPSEITSPTASKSGTATTTKSNPVVKINYNVIQKNKQMKIMQYYRRSLKSQLASAREPIKYKRTRKHIAQSSSMGNPSNPTSSGKLTKTQPMDKDKEKEQEKEKEHEKKLEKHETTYKQYHHRGGDSENQIVIMD